MKINKKLNYIFIGSMILANMLTYADSSNSPLSNTSSSENSGKSKSKKQIHSTFSKIGKVVGISLVTGTCEAILVQICKDMKKLEKGTETSTTVPGAGLYNALASGKEYLLGSFMPRIAKQVPGAAAVTLINSKSQFKTLSLYSGCRLACELIPAVYKFMKVKRANAYSANRLDL